MSDALTWELDIDTEDIDGVTLASLCFTTGCGQVKVDHFTPAALRAMADQLYDHANNMDGKGFFNPTGLKRQLAKAIPYIGEHPYNVPDGLIDECERAAGIELPEDEQMARDVVYLDNDEEDAA